MKLIIWGTGEAAKNFLGQECMYAEDDIVAFTDNNSRLWGKIFNGVPIIPPMEISSTVYDKILICASAEKEIKKQMLDEIHIRAENITSYAEILNRLAKRIIKKYRDSEDKEIQHILHYYSMNGFNIFGTYNANPKNVYKIFRDKDNMPYLRWDNKAIYFPYNYKFYRLDGQEIFYDLFGEQGKDSPHMYMKEGFHIDYGDVMVDAGTCEGNFAIQFIDKVKKLYLIEPNPEWIKALRRTFKDYEDKVVFCDKFLSNYNSQSTITLDNLIQEEINFLKMDIEGAEIQALLGGKEILKNSNAFCSICSYHRQNDESNIKFLLEAMGYRTSVSNGFMFFPFDSAIKDTMDFRRGIVYGEKS